MLKNVYSCFGVFWNFSLKILYKEKGGLEYATQKMLEHQEKALKILEKYPNSEYKEALKLMINYVVERKI